MFGTYRTLLALMVVALHLGGVPILGGYAVFGFYGLSGYLMTFIMHNTYGYTRSGVWRYLCNRALRIYPMYWVAIALSVLLILLLGEAFTTRYEASLFLPQQLGPIARNSLLIFSHKDLPRLSPPAWALTVELCFYLLIGLGLSRYRRRVWYWLVASLLYHAVVNAMGLGVDYIYFAIPAASLPFSTGALIYHYRREIFQKTGSLQPAIQAYLPLLVLMAILINWQIGLVTGTAKGLCFYSNCVLCALMIPALMDRKYLPLISRSLDQWLGTLSYPIYLVHYQAGLIVVAGLEMTGKHFAIPDPQVMALSIPVMFALAWLLAIAVEKPIEHLRLKLK